MDITILFTSQNKDVYEWAKVQESNILTEIFCMGYSINTSGISNYTKNHYIDIKMRNIEKERDEYKEKSDNAEEYIRAKIDEKVNKALETEKAFREKQQNLEKSQINSEIELYKTQLRNYTLLVKNLTEKLNNTENDIDDRVKSNVSKITTNLEEIKKAESNYYKELISAENKKYKDLENKIDTIKKEQHIIAETRRKEELEKAEARRREDLQREKLLRETVETQFNTLLENTQEQRVLKKE